MNTSLSIALYKPRTGGEAALDEILLEHIPTLRNLGLITDGTAYTAKAADGTVMEVFEWLSEAAKDEAHQNPEVRKLWERMMAVCDFPGLKDLPDAHKAFSNFEVQARR